MTKDQERRLRSIMADIEALLADVETEAREEGYVDGHTDGVSESESNQ